MIDKLALFCYRHKIENVIVIPTIIAMILLCVALIAIRIAKGYEESALFSFCIIIAIVLLFFAFLFSLNTFDSLQKRGSKLPEVILDEANKAFGIGPEDPNVRAFLEHWIRQAEKGNPQNLMTAWPLIRRILAEERIIREAEERLRKSNKKISTFISLNHDIGCD